MSKNKLDFEVVNRRKKSIEPTEVLPPETKSEPNTIILPNGNSIRLSADDVSHMIRVGSDVILSLKDMYLAKQETENKIKLIREEANRIKQETELRIKEKENDHKNRLEHFDKKNEQLQWCLNWLENNPGRSAAELVALIESLSKKIN